MLASPSLSHTSRERDLAIVRSKEASPRHLSLSCFRREASWGERFRVSWAVSNLRMSSWAIRSCILMLPTDFSPQPRSPRARALNLRSRATRGSQGPESTPLAFAAHRRFTSSEKPGREVQKDSNWKRGLTEMLQAVDMRSGTWSDIEDESAERRLSGWASSQSTVENHRSSFSRVGVWRSLLHVYERPISGASFNIRSLIVRRKEFIKRLLRRP